MEVLPRSSETGRVGHGVDGERDDGPMSAGATDEPILHFGGDYRFSIGGTGRSGEPV